MKGIFLDIDGVINDHYNIRYNRRNGEFQPLDRRMVNMLRVITEDCPEAKIIISSTWRKLYTGPEFVEIFKEAGWDIGDTLLGCTPEGSGWRGHEIEAWLKEHPLEKFVILDDDLDVLEEHGPNFMWINPDIGFTMAHVRSIRDYFKGVTESLTPVTYNSARTERVTEPKRCQCTYRGRMQAVYK